MNILKKTAEIITYILAIALTSVFWWMCTVRNLMPTQPNRPAYMERQTVDGR